MQLAVPRPRPGLWDIFATWLTLGVQSFGGGSSTFYLIHQACTSRGWVEEGEFVKTWALVQIAPGINLVKLTALLGYRLRGWPGLVAACAGLLLPSALVTVLMTAGFALIRDQPVVRAAMKGVLPATIGLSLAMAAQMAQPIVSRAGHEGHPRLAAHLLVLVVSALLLAFTGMSPAAVLLLSGFGTAAVLAVLPAPAAPPVGKLVEQKEESKA